MNILVVSDKEENELWSGWCDAEAEKLKDVKLVLSAGDLMPKYLEFLVTMLNVPLLYVRGNHDSIYDEEPPEGCINIDGDYVDVECEPDGAVSICHSGLGERVRRMFSSDDSSSEEKRVIRIAGLGGSMRYREGSDMYNETEMAARVRKLEWKLHHKGLDILLTHAPCRGYGDMEDIAHRGFSCFNKMIEDTRPSCHCYGHVHMEYGRFERESLHKSGTKLINVSGMYILEI